MRKRAAQERQCSCGRAVVVQDMEMRKEHAEDSDSIYGETGFSDKGSV